MAKKCFRNVCTLSVGLVAASLLGCADDPGEENARKPENLDGQVIRCQGEVVVGPEDSGMWVPVEAMTRRLRAFPEFAAFAGLSWVSNCAEARAYTEAYERYQAAYPDFDRFLRPIAVDESMTRASAARMMVQNGVDTWADFWNGISPIVRLDQKEWTPNGTPTGKNEFCEDKGYCTGTFIAKNWILTAAHCLPPAGRPGARKTKPGDTCPNTVVPPARKWQDAQGQASWIISWAGSRSGLRPYSYSALVTDVYQLPFWGWNGAGNGAANLMPNGNDYALLYVPTFDHRNALLPSDVTAGMAVGLPVEQKASNVPSELFEFAGYGLGSYQNGNPTPPTDLIPLREAQAPYLVWNYSIQATVGDAMSGVRAHNVFCHGDSGGPLYRKLEVFGSGRLLLYGIISGLDTSLKVCPSDGVVMYWGRTDRRPDFINWINEKLRDFNQGPCTDEPTGDPNVPREYLCYSKQCSADAECESGEYCAGGPDDLKNNNVTCRPEICNTYEEIIAKTAKKNCDCVKGQCLKRPAKKNPSSDAGRAG